MLCKEECLEKESDITMEHDGGRTKIDTGTYEGAESSHCMGESQQLKSQVKKKEQF